MYICINVRSTSFLDLYIPAICSLVSHRDKRQSAARVRQFSPTLRLSTTESTFSRYPVDRRWQRQFCFSTDRSAGCICWRGPSLVLEPRRSSVRRRSTPRSPQERSRTDWSLGRDRPTATGISSYPPPSVSEESTP